MKTATTTTTTSIIVQRGEEDQDCDAKEKKINDSPLGSCMSANERRRISGRRLNSLHPKSDLSRKKRRPEIPLQPWFFVRQTEIILQTALLFSFFFLPFFGEALSSGRVA